MFDCYITATNVIDVFFGLATKRNDGETECAVCGACPYPPALLREFPTVVDVRVGVQKPHVAVTGVLGSLGVEIFRTR